MLGEWFHSKLPWVLDLWIDRQETTIERHSYCSKAEPEISGSQRHNAQNAARVLNGSGYAKLGGEGEYIRDKHVLPT